MSLTLKQELWVEHYLKTRNATEAARRAGYSGDDAALARRGHENRRNSKVRKRIEERLRELHLSADEVLKALRDQAYPDFERIAQAFDGAETIPEVLRRANRLGLSHMIKRIKQMRDGSLEVQFYDAQRALELIGRHHRLFIDRIEHSGNIDVDGTWTVEWGGEPSGAPGE